ncbi:peptidase [Mycolicibacterium hippocampi]|uniref:peptidase n=1 Tax=Mycolicibacterium hippocampi TaxID=659824 RepID=UPI0035188362
MSRSTGRYRRRRHLVGATIATCSVLFGSACSTTLQGQAVSVFDDPFSVAGMPATDGPTGLRPNAEGPTRDIEGTDGGEIDQLAAAAISDIEQYWEYSYPETFGDDFTPARTVVSWDAAGFDTEFCGDRTYGLVNAGFCYPDRTLGWDRGELLPSLRAAHGDIGVVMVLAHEYGHAVSRLSGMSKRGTPTLVNEQQADCLSGAYMRWVAEDNSPRFTLSTSEGLNNVLAGVISFRDPVLNEGDPDVGYDEHGSAFERVSAFQFGFTDGPAACAAIDLREIGQRRGDLPVLLPEDQTGELAVTEDSVRSIVDAMGILFEPADPPALSFDPADAENCGDVRPSPPASFCPSKNTIVIDLPGLEVLGIQGTPRDGSNLATGDNMAYSVLVSRYMLAIQQEHGGVELDTAAAALRTACLSGVATVKMSKEVTTPDGNTIALTAGDIDEAVSGILTNGLVASDVNGESVPSGFSRIDAFRVGVLGDVERCFKRFR